MLLRCPGLGPGRRADRRRAAGPRPGSRRRVLARSRRCRRQRRRARASRPARAPRSGVRPSRPSQPGRLAAAGIGHVDLQFVVAVVERDRGGGRAGVPDGVGQRLLGDAVGGQVDGGRERDLLPGHRERRLQASPARPGDEVLDLGGARGRLGGVGVVGLAQHVQDGAQFPKPLLARHLDRLQRFGGRLRAAGQHVGRHPRLHVDSGHGVGDDVVQFAGDAQSFLVDAPAGVLFGPVLDGFHVGLPVRHRDPGDHHHGDHERENFHTAAERPERVDRDAGQAEHDQRPQPVRHRPADAGLAGHRVEGDHRGHEHCAVQVAEQGVNRRGRHRDAEHHDRPPASPGEHQAGHGDEDERGRRGVGQVMAATEVGGRAGMGLAVRTVDQRNGYHQSDDHVPDGRAERSPPRRHTFHARKRRHAGSRSRPPPVDHLATPPGVRGPRSARGGTAKCQPPPDHKPRGRAAV